MAREFKAIEDQITVTYEIGDGFLVDVVANKEKREAWLYHQDYGIKMHVFGVDDPELVKDFKKVLSLNIEKFVDDYQEKYLDA